MSAELTSIQQPGLSQEIIRRAADVCEIQLGHILRFCKNNGIVVFQMLAITLSFCPGSASV